MNKIEQWLNAIITEDGHRMSSGSLRTIEMIRRELAQKQNLQQTPCKAKLPSSSEMGLCRICGGDQCDSDSHK